MHMLLALVEDQLRLQLILQSGMSGMMRPYEDATMTKHVLVWRYCWGAKYVLDVCYMYCRRPRSRLQDKHCQ